MRPLASWVRSAGSRIVAPAARRFARFRLRRRILRRLRELRPLATSFRSAGYMIMLPVTRRLRLRRLFFKRWLELPA